MLNKLRSLFARQEEPAREENTLPLAVAALLVEAARADENYEEAEKPLIDKALAALFNLEPEAASRLRADGERAQAEAVDLHRFTKIAKSMAPDAKLKLIEGLWEIVLSDGARDPHEDALMRRICGLIYVADPDSGAARRRAEATLRARNQQ